MTIVLINSFLVFVIAITSAFFTASNKKSLPLVSWSFLAVALIYGIGSAVVFSATLGGVDYTRSDIVLSNKLYWPFYGPLVILLTIGIMVGWKLPIKIKNYLEKLSRITFSSRDSKNLYAAIIILLLSFLIRWLYVLEFGGFIQYLEYSRLIRSGASDISNPFSFLKPFGELAVISSFMFWGLWIKKYKKLISFIGLTLSLLFSVYILFSNAGRVSLVLYFATFLVAYAYQSNIKSKTILLFAVIGFPVVIISLYYISLYFQIKAADSISYYFIKETSFVFVSFFAQLSEGDLFRLFIDFLMAPTHLLPSSWTLDWYESASQTNTIIISGAIKGEGGVTGGIPVDLMTLGLMQINALGILPVGMLFGIVIRRLDYFLRLIQNKPLQNILISYFSLRIAFIGILYSQPDHFIGGLFSLISVLIILYIINTFGRAKILN